MKKESRRAGEDDPMISDRHWHIDKRIPLALIVVLLLQTFGMGWWASSTEARLSNVEKRIEASAPIGDRLTRVEVKIETLQTGVEEIKTILRAKTP